MTRSPISHDPHRPPRGRRAASRWGLRHLLLMVGLSAGATWWVTQLGQEVLVVEVVGLDALPLRGASDGCLLEVSKISFCLHEPAAPAEQQTHWFLEPPARLNRILAVGDRFPLRYRAHPWLGRAARDPLEVLAGHWEIPPGSIRESITEVLPPR